MTSRPGCTYDGCTNLAAYKILHDDRLTDQYRCFEHVVMDIIRETNEPPSTPEADEPPMQ